MAEENQEPINWVTETEERTDVQPTDVLLLGVPSTGKSLHIPISEISASIQKGQPLNKNTMEEMRALTDAEIDGLVRGIYSHVQLNGYYEAGDTPAAINYYISDTADPDDGGSVIEVGDIKLEHEYSYDVDARYFGARALPGLDNSAVLSRIESYLSGVSNKNLIIEALDGESFETSSEFNLPVGHDLNCVSTLVFTNGDDDRGLIIGNTTTRNYNRVFKIRVRKASLSNWGNKDNIGVLVYNAYECMINVIRAQDFTSAFVGMGVGNGFAYNQVNANTIINARYAFTLTNSDLGWANQNTVIISRVQINTGVHTDKSRYGIVLDSEDGLYKNNNNNVFINSSIELNSPSGVETAVVWAKAATLNSFINIRNEGNSNGINGARVYIAEDTSNSNYVSENYSNSSSSILNKSINRGGYIGFIGENLSGFTSSLSSRVLLYDSGHLPNKLSQYNTTNTRGSGALFFGSAGSSSRFRQATSITLNKDFVTFGSARGIGITIDSSTVKEFQIKREFHASGTQVNRLNVRLYDINGEILTNETGQHVTSGTTGATWIYSAAAYFGWQPGTDGNLNSIKLSEEVKSFDIILRGGSDVYLTNFKVYAMENTAKVLNVGSESLVCNIEPTIEVNEPTFYYCDNVSLGLLGWIFVGSQWRPVINPSSATASVKGVVNQGVAVPDGSSVDTLLASLRTAGIIAT